MGAHALTQGATPPAVGWTAIDSVLLGSLHNYRLHLRHYPVFNESIPTADVAGRLSLLGHGVAGLGAGLTRYPLHQFCHVCYLNSTSAFVATPIELVKGTPTTYKYFALYRLRHVSQSNSKCNGKTTDRLVSSKGP